MLEGGGLASSLLRLVKKRPTFPFSIFETSARPSWYSVFAACPSATFITFVDPKQNLEA